MAAIQSSFSSLKSGFGSMSTDDRIEVAGRVVGAGALPYLIAEVGQGHEGSLGLAHQFIEAAADAGADAVKFQTHFAEEESTLDEPFRVKFSLQDESRYSYWRRMEFSDEQWSGLSAHAHRRGLHFLSSAFSLRAVELLDRLGVAAWKIASGEVGSLDLLERMAQARRPILMSSGMSSYEEIDQVVTMLGVRQIPFAIFQCTSMYPTPLEAVGLNVLGALRARYGCPVGLSDHSGVVFPSLAALAQGAHLIEVHLTLDRRMFGPDVQSSLTVEEFTLLRSARDAFATLTANPVDKDALGLQLTATRNLFQKSLAPIRDLPAGTVLTRELLTAKKPGIGIPPRDINAIIGKRLANDVASNRILKWTDLDE